MLSDWWAWRPRKDKKGMVADEEGKFWVKGTVRDWRLGDRLDGRKILEEGCTVLVEGECRKSSTVIRATEELHELGFPPIGLRLSTVVPLITYSTSVAVETDYRSPVAEYGVIWCGWIDDSGDLESYESAVLGMNDLDISVV